METAVTTSISWGLRAHHQPSTLVFLLAGIVGFARRVTNAIRNRNEAAMLGSFDDRMLADIGLTRSDVRDAYSEPLWRDPTTILASRVHERRLNRPHGNLGEIEQLISPPLAPQSGYKPLRTDRPARYLI